MTAEAWLAVVTVVGSVLCNGIVLAFYVGRLTNRLENNELNCGKHTGQIGDILDTLHSYPNGHGVRLTRLETREEDERNRDERDRDKR